MENILVVVPHQDDESNLIGNCIENLKELGNIILVYTSIEQDVKKSRIRKTEAYNACEVLGINKENIIFLEYPDTPNRTGSHFFTEGNKKIVDDLKDIIKRHRPKYIFGTDFDYHSDHRMASLALDEVVGKIINEDQEYRPIVFKGFCYDTTYYGVDDYKASKLDTTICKNDILSNCTYEWNKRYSIKSKEKDGFIWNKKLYKALKKHKSQYAILHAKSIINADNVFWLRRTDNILNEAEVSVSSGNADKLKDFMIIDTNDIITENPKEINYDKSLWLPDNDDKNPYINIKLKRKRNIKYIVLYGNPTIEKDINISYNINANGQAIKNDKIRAYARKTIINANLNNVDNIKISFNEDIKNIGISEIEMFENDIELNDMFKQNIEYINNKRNLKDLVNDFMYLVIVFITKVKRKIRTSYKKIK